MMKIVPIPPKRHEPAREIKLAPGWDLVASDGKHRMPSVSESSPVCVRADGMRIVHWHSAVDKGGKVIEFWVLVHPRFGEFHHECYRTPEIGMREADHEFPLQEIDVEATRAHLRRRAIRHLREGL
jgi:hypothetical protein